MCSTSASPLARLHPSGLMEFFREKLTRCQEDTARVELLLLLSEVISAHCEARGGEECALAWQLTHPSCWLGVQASFWPGWAA